jgi:CheY-like chemotaxis protein
MRVRGGARRARRCNWNTFCFDDPGKTPAKSEAIMQTGVESSRAVENKRVFVVDSDEITRAVLQFMLHDENETHEIAGVAAAYEKAANWKPDVILLGMPIVQASGVGIVAEIRERIPGAKIAIVADSATDATARSCLKSGAHSLLTKPFTIESVRRKVDILLGRRTSLSIPVQVA